MSPLPNREDTVPPTKVRSALRKWCGLHATQKWECAESEFSKAAAAEAAFVEPRLMLAEIAEQKGNDAEAIRRYREVLGISKGVFTVAQLHLADLEFRGGQYEEAEKNYRAYLAAEDDPQRKARARMGIENCAFASVAITHPVPFEPKNLGPSINSVDPEYYPCITADDNTFIYTRRVKDSSIIPWGMQEDFMVSHRALDASATSIPIPTVNTPVQRGAGTLTLMAFHRIHEMCYGGGSYGGDLVVLVHVICSSVAVSVSVDPPENLARLLIRAIGKRNRAWVAMV